MGSYASVSGKWCLKKRGEGKRYSDGPAFLLCSVCVLIFEIITVTLFLAVVISRCVILSDLAVSCCCLTLW